MSNPKCPTIKFIIQAVDSEDSTLFEDFKTKMKVENRVQSKVVKHLIKGVVRNKIKLPDSTIIKSKLK